MKIFFKKRSNLSSERVWTCVCVYVGCMSSCAENKWSSFRSLVVFELFCGTFHKIFTPQLIFIIIFRFLILLILVFQRKLFRISFCIRIKERNTTKQEQWSQIFFFIRKYNCQKTHTRFLTWDTFHYITKFTSIEFLCVNYFLYSKKKYCKKTTTLKTDKVSLLKLK